MQRGCVTKRSVIMLPVLLAGFTGPCRAGADTIVRASPDIRVFLTNLSVGSRLGGGIGGFLKRKVAVDNIRKHIKILLNIS
jgi:hypothetical protein